MARPNRSPTFVEAMEVESNELALMVNFADLLFLVGFAFLNQLLCIMVYGRPKEFLLYCLAR
jgi:hypothetical protein